MSARAFHRILTLARTIADLAGSERIKWPHRPEEVPVTVGDVIEMQANHVAYHIDGIRTLAPVSFTRKQSVRA